MATYARPRVMIALPKIKEEASAFLSGVARFQKEKAHWSVYLDDGELSAGACSAHLGDRWEGILSAIPTPGLDTWSRARRIPMVDVSDGPSFAGIPYIKSDNQMIGRIAAEDFIERGYTRFAYCGYSNRHSSRERNAGFIEAINHVRGTCSHFLTENSVQHNVPWTVHQVSQIETWLASLPKPVGILACDDERAGHIIQAAENIGCSVPEEVAVLGVGDDRARCELMQPPLSSIALNASEQGFRAAELLFQLMAGTPVKNATLRISPVGISARQSTDAMALSDGRVESALRFIRENASKGLTVDQVVSHTKTPRHVLERSMRKQLGRSPQEEIRRLQIIEIKQLLQHTSLSLREIAARCGFAYVEHLSVLFKRLVGETPGRFRRQAKGGGLRAGRKIPATSRKPRTSPSPTAVPSR